MTRTITLPKHQFVEILRSAQTLPPSARAAFVTAVKRRLPHHLSDAAVSAAITAELSLNKLPNFICCGDAK